MNRTAASLALAATLGTAALTWGTLPAGATCGHEGQPEWCPPISAPPSTSTTQTTQVPQTATSVAPSTAAPTTVAPPSTIEAVIGEALSISVGAQPVPVGVPDFAG